MQKHIVNAEPPRNRNHCSWQAEGCSSVLIFIINNLPIYNMLCLLKKRYLYIFLVCICIYIYVCARALDRYILCEMRFNICLQVNIYYSLVTYAWYDCNWRSEVYMYKLSCLWFNASRAGASAGWISACRPTHWIEEALVLLGIFSKYSNFDALDMMKRTCML